MSLTPNLLRSRLAPTPSGYLHLGNAFNFVLTWLIVRKNGGALVLRIDDLDKDRINPTYIEDIFKTLDWLGIDYDEGPSGPGDFYQFFSQQKKMELYHEATDCLLLTGRLFACDCSRTKIRNLSQNGLYPGTCRDLELPLGQPGLADRLRVERRDVIEWKDMLLGQQKIDLFMEMGDFVVRRKDDLPAYQIASLVDDVAVGINCIVRGEDLLSSTAAQLLLANLLGYHAFEKSIFYHHPLVPGPDGNKLSKSAGATAIRNWAKHQGSHLQFIQFAAESLGLPGAEISCLSELLDAFKGQDTDSINFPNLSG